MPKPNVSTKEPLLIKDQATVVKNQPLLSKNQVAAVKKYFQEHPNLTKIPRGTRIYEQTLPYSVIKGTNRYYVLYRSYQHNKFKRPETDFFGKLQKYYGGGVFGVVKGARDIDTQEDFVIKRYKKYDLDDIKHEETMQQQLDLYIDSVTRRKGSLTRKGSKAPVNIAYTLSRVVPGIPLADFAKNQEAQFKRNRQIDHLKILKAMLATLKATEFIHQREIIHNDLNARNIMISNNKDLTATIIDFGTSVQSSHGEARRVLYTTGLKEYHYVAPETRKGKPKEDKEVTRETLALPERFIAKDDQEKYLLTTAADIYSLSSEFDRIFKFSIDTLDPQIKEILRNTLDKMHQTNPDLRPPISACIEKLILCLLLQHAKNQPYDPVAVAELIKNNHEIISDQTIVQLVKLNCYHLEHILRSIQIPPPREANLIPLLQAEQVPPDLIGKFKNILKKPRKTTKSTNNQKRKKPRTPFALIKQSITSITKQIPSENPSNQQKQHFTK